MALPALGALLQLRNNERNRNRDFNLERRWLRNGSNPFELTNCEFIRLFRADKETTRYIINRLRNHLASSRSDGLSPEIKVLITLRFLGFGNYQRVVGQGFFLAASQPSVSRCIRTVTTCINRIFLHETVRFPSTVEEREIVSRRFLEPAGFPGILGCIDCTHVAIVTPHVQEDAYKNHHGYYSLNVQMICDEQLRITNVNANFPGSVHDQFIFNASQVKQEMIRLHNDRIGKFFLLGDSGYSLQKYMLTPVLDARPDTAEERYTRRHCQVRNRVERLFGVLKARWRCIKRDRVLHYQPEAAAAIVYSCAILHNLLLDRVPLPADDDADIPLRQMWDVGHGHGNNENNLDGETIRTQIINTYFDNHN